MDESGGSGRPQSDEHAPAQAEDASGQAETAPGGAASASGQAETAPGRAASASGEAPSAAVRAESAPVQAGEGQAGVRPDGDGAPDRPDGAPAIGPD
ncbi:hypothetical protein AABC07_30310, partial [Streptomyces sp. LNU-CPARS28]